MASQLLRVLNPLRSTPTGAQSISIALEPANLGTVRATVTLDAGQMLIRLAPVSPEAEATIRAALPELHAGLNEAGTPSTLVLLPSDGGASGSSSSGGGAYPSAPERANELIAPPRDEAASPLAAPEGTVPAPSSNASLLDVRL